MESNLDLSDVTKNPSAYIEFKNCTLAADFSALFWRTPDMPLYYMADLLRDGLSGYLARGNHSLPADWELVKWFGNDLSHYNDDDDEFSLILKSIYDFVSQECLRELCPRLGGRGDSDVAGIGMQINYTIMALLTTFYWGFLARFPILEKFRTRYLPSGLLLAVKCSVKTILDTAIVFALAMLLAALCTYARILSSHGNVVNFYSSAVAHYLAFWSVLPVLTVQQSASTILRRTKSRAIVYCFMNVLILVDLSICWAVYLNSRIYSDVEIFQYDTDFQIYFNEYCLPDIMFPSAAITSLIATWNLLFLILTITSTWPRLLTRMLLSLSRRSPSSKRKEIERRIEFNNLRSQTCYSAATCMFMWISFGLFIYGHHRLLASAGPSNRERELSFGQILSLTTWLPVLLDFGYIYIKGPRDALTGQMVKPYCAEVDDAIDDDQIELTESTGEEVMAGAGSTKAESSELCVSTQESCREIETSPEQRLLGSDRKQWDDVLRKD